MMNRRIRSIKRLFGCSILPQTDPFVSTLMAYTISSTSVMLVPLNKPRNRKIISYPFIIVDEFDCMFCFLTESCDGFDFMRSGVSFSSGDFNCYFTSIMAFHWRCVDIVALNWDKSGSFHPWLIPNKLTRNMGIDNRELN